MVEKQFDRSIEPDFDEALSKLATRAEWWSDALKDPSLLIALRKANINVYYLGQSILNVSYVKKVVRFSTHEKYLINSSLDKQVVLSEDGIFDIERLINRAFIKNYHASKNLRTLKKAAEYYTSLEKTNCHRLCVAEHNSNVIDVEIALTQEAAEAEEHVDGLRTVAEDEKALKAEAGRIDIATLEAFGDHARIAFWEAKNYSNPEIRRGSKGIPVIGQIQKYIANLKVKRDAVEMSYEKVCKNLVSLRKMGSVRSLHPLIEDVAAGRRRITLGDRPKVGLILFQYDEAQRKQIEHDKSIIDIKKALEEANEPGAKVFLQRGGAAGVRLPA